MCWYYCVGTVHLHNLEVFLMEIKLEKKSVVCFKCVSKMCNLGHV